MSQDRVSETTVRMGSRKLQIPVANLAVAYVLEELMIRLEQSVYQESIWLKDTLNLGLENYRSRLILNIDFLYKKELCDRSGSVVSNGELLKDIFREICHISDSDSVFDSIKLIEQNVTCEIQLTANIGSIRVPLHIHMEPLNDSNIEPYPAKIHLYTRNTENVCLNQYPIEYSVADQLFIIISRLELINDMSIYEKLYSVLVKQSLDGRKIQAELMKQCKIGNIILNEKYMNQLAKYPEYTYMSKKWDHYMKQVQSKLPDWSTVMNSIFLSLEPVWKAMQQDMIFIGDWMPELQRYL